jgi:hypothetical protein
MTQDAERMRKLRDTRRELGWKIVNVMVPTVADANELRRMANRLVVAHFSKLTDSDGPVGSKLKPGRKSKPKPEPVVKPVGIGYPHMSSVPGECNDFDSVVAKEVNASATVIAADIVKANYANGSVVRDPSKEQMMTRNGVGRMPISLKGFPPLLGKSSV